MTKEPGATQNQDAKSIVDFLIRESETELSRDEVEIIFNEEYSRLARKARIKGYLQLLSYRSTLERLRITTLIHG